MHNNNIKNHFEKCIYTKNLIFLFIIFLDILDFDKEFPMQDAFVSSTVTNSHIYPEFDEVKLGM